MLSANWLSLALMLVTYKIAVIRSGEHSQRNKIVDSYERQKARVLDHLRGSVSAVMIRSNNDNMKSILNAWSARRQMLGDELMTIWEQPKMRGRHLLVIPCQALGEYYLRLADEDWLEYAIYKYRNRNHSHHIINICINPSAEENRRIEVSWRFH